MAFRRRARFPAEPLLWPERPRHLKFMNYVSWVYAIRRYLQYRWRPGTRWYWIFVNAMEMQELVLQLMRLALYSGRNIWEETSIPAFSDKVVIFHTCVIFADQVAIGMNTLLGSVSSQTVCEVVIDIVY